MADETTPRAVVDASVLIAHLNKEEDRYEKSRDLLDYAERGRIDLWAPMVIQVEVSRWSREVEQSGQQARDKLSAFLDSDWLYAVEVDRRMARIARDIVATTSVRTGVDALYVATAVIVEASVVYSWDARMLETAYDEIVCMSPPGAAEPTLDFRGERESGTRRSGEVEGSASEEGGDQPPK